MAKITKEEKIDQNPFLDQLYNQKTNFKLPRVPVSATRDYRWVRKSIGGSEDVSNISKMLNMDARLDWKVATKADVPALANYEKDGVIQYMDVILMHCDKRMGKYWREMIQAKASMQMEQLKAEATRIKDKQGRSVFRIEDRVDDAKEVDFE